MVARILAATVAGAITIFVYGFLVWGMVLADAMQPHMNTYEGLMKAMPDWPFLVAANFVNALYLAFILDWSGRRNFASGATAGAIISFLVSLTIQLMYIAFMNFHKNYIPVAVDLVATTVMGALAGGVIGLVLGKMYKDTVV